MKATLTLLGSITLTAVGLSLPAVHPIVPEKPTSIPINHVLPIPDASAAGPPQNHPSQPWESDRTAVVALALDEASRLELRDDIDGAIAAVSLPLADFDAPALRARRAELAERRLLRLATDAELSGRPDIARDFYVQALGVRGNQPGIASRIDDLEVIAAIEQRATDAEANARELLTIVERSERQVADLLRQANDFDRTANQLDRDRQRAEADARDADRAIQDLRRCIRDLERSNECLKRDLYNARCDVDRWRRKYEQERRYHHRD